MSAEDEISALQRESEIPIDDLLESLPLEMFTEHSAQSNVIKDDDGGDVVDETKM